MKRAALPQNESERLAALDRYNILGSQPEAIYDEIAFLATAIADVPISVISFVSKDKQWFKAKMGLDIGESSRELAFCAHAMLGTELFIVEDASVDPRFSDNPFVTAPNGIRFYAGAPLIDSKGFALGALAVIDTKPRKLKAKTLKSLQLLARQIIQHLESRVQVLTQSIAHEVVSVEKDLYLGLVSSLNDVVFQMSNLGDLKFRSPAWPRLTGYEIVASSEQNFFDLVHKDDSPKLKSLVSALVVGQPSAPTKIRILKADGTNAFASLTLVLQVAEEGESPKINGVLTDVSEFEFANALALERARDLSSIFEAVPFQIGLIELTDGHVSVVSTNALGRSGLGIDPGVSLPVRVTDIGIGNDVSSFWIEKYRESFKLQRPVSFDTMIETAAGERWFSCSVNRCSSDYPNRFVFVAKDVTEKWKQEAVMSEARAKLIDAGRLSSLAEMAAGLAHEINNPLAIISALNERMMNDALVKKDTTGRLKANVLKIDHATERIAKLVSSLRKLSRDGHADAFVEYSIQQLVEDSLAMCRTRYRSFDIAIHVRGPKAPLMAWIRPVPMTQVLVNLLSNAYEAISKLNEKVIEIDIRAEGDKFVVAVTDSGSGIAKEHRPRVFEPFFTTGAPARAGIGLSISRGIVEGHGGQLELDTESDRTRFTISMPIENRSSKNLKLAAGGFDV